MAHLAGRCARFCTTGSCDLSGEIILETTGLTKEFKGFVAVNNVNLQVRRGDIHALIGPNGAGKTTAFNCISRTTRPTSGEVRLDGRRIDHGERRRQRCPGTVCAPV